uniref:BTB domain-containing protein n=1 Tax=Magallana gigas TaxID=29159 RepID=A0A8W8LQW1_MAGGI|nr:BTB and MATH domain-containing protein 38 [Crassostrea gigas]
MASPDYPASPSISSDSNLELVNEHFKYDQEVTDLTLIVENQRFHVSKAVLIDASPVFRKMLTGEFKEKHRTEIELPGKKSSSFELFLRCIFPREYITLTESWIDEILPLAGEYEVKCVLLKCENWLLKKAKVTPSYTHEGVDEDVNFLMKCICYGEKYSLKNLYKLCSSKVLSYKLHRYKENEHYQMLPESHKRQLLEDRLLEIETRGKISRQNTAFSTELFECTLSLFL